MRVLQFNNYADAVGGAEVYLLGLSAELRRRGHTVTVFGSVPEGAPAPASEGLCLVRRPRYDVARLTRDPEVLAALHTCVERSAPELVHVHNVFSVGLDVLLYLARSGVPLVQTVHDFNLLCPNSWCVRGDGTPCPGGAGEQCFQHGCEKNYPYDAWGVLQTALRQRLLASSVRLAISPSRYLAEHLRRHGFGDVRCLPYFIEPDSFAPGAEPRADDRLLYAGRLEPEKGVGTLLEAMPALLQPRPTVRLDVVGGGSQAALLRARARDLGLEGAVVFHEKLPRAELRAFYARATACVLPSLWAENSPLVAYECLSAGLPMLASERGGLPELLEGGAGGSTFRAGDARHLAERALALLALPRAERVRLSSWLRARAASLAPGPHLERIEALYAEALAAPAGSAPALDEDLLAALDAVGRGPGSRAPSGALERLRGIARALGLPKLTRP